MKKAVELDGVDLIGYTPWGCIDLVSFTTGEMKKDMDLFMSILITKEMEAETGIRRSLLTGTRT